jgi:hypothetical protein
MSHQISSNVHQNGCKAAAKFLKGALAIRESSRKVFENQYLSEMTSGTSPSRGIDD